MKAKIWYNRVITGQVNFSEIPVDVKEAVKAMLIEANRDDLVKENNQ